MNNQRRFLLVRASIYLSGLAVIFWVIGVNVWEIREKTDTPIKTENGDFIVYTDRNYQNAELTIEFENQIPEILTTTIQKDFSIFLSSRAEGIYTEEDLKAKLFKDNSSQYPNGSFLNYKNDIYLVEEGQLRKLDNSKILNFFNLKKGDLPQLNSEDFKKFIQAQPFSYLSLQHEFPQEMLIGKGSDFFITGEKGYYPIYLSDLEKIQNELNLQVSPISNKTTRGDCFKLTDQKISCRFDLSQLKSNSGNIYRLSIKETNSQPNQPPETIKTTSLTLQANPSFAETMNEVKKIFIK